MDNTNASDKIKGYTNKKTKVLYNFLKYLDLNVDREPFASSQALFYANDYMLQEITHASYLTPSLVSAFLPAATKLNLTLSGILLLSLAIYAGNNFFFHNNSLG